VRRVAEWSLWLDEHLLAPVAHRQVVRTVPKRLRAYFFYDRRRLGRLSRIATRTLCDYVEAAVGEPEAVPGLIVCVQTFGSVAHRHPHLHVLMTDGGYRRDGRFVGLPEPEPAVLEALWQRAVLAEFVRRAWLEEAAAAATLAWSHSGFDAYLGSRIVERAGQLRVARYAARAQVAEGWLRYDAARAEVELVANRVDGPYAGVHRMGALKFIARWVDHVPERYEVSGACPAGAERGGERASGLPRGVRRGSARSRRAGLGFRASAVGKQAWSRAYGSAYPSLRGPDKIGRPDGN